MAWELEVSNDAEVTDTISTIINTINVYGKSEFIKNIIEPLDPNSPQFVHNLFDFVCEKVQYKNDPVGHEKIYTPARLLQEGKGDCKKMTTFIASCLKAAGIEPLLKVISYDGIHYEHIYVICKIGHEYIILDPVNNCQYNKEIPHSTSCIYNLQGDVMEKMKLSLLGNRNPNFSRDSFDFSMALRGINNDLDKIANNNASPRTNPEAQIYTAAEWEEMFKNLKIKDQFLPIYLDKILSHQNEIARVLPRAKELLNQASVSGPENTTGPGGRSEDTNYVAPSDPNSIENTTGGEGRATGIPGTEGTTSLDQKLVNIMSNPAAQVAYWKDKLQPVISNSFSQGMERLTHQYGLTAASDHPDLVDKEKIDAFSGAISFFDLNDTYNAASYNIAVMNGLSWDDFTYNYVAVTAFNYNNEPHSFGEKALHVTAQVVMFPVRQAFLLIIDAGEFAKQFAGLNYAENLANSWNSPGRAAWDICNIWYKFGGDWVALKKAIKTGTGAKIQLRGLGFTGVEVVAALGVATPIIVALLSFMKKVDPKNAEAYDNAAQTVSNVNTATGGATRDTDGTFNFNGTTCVAAKNGKYPSSASCVAANAGAEVDAGYHIDEGGNLVTNTPSAASFFSTNYTNNIIKCLFLLCIFPGHTSSFINILFISGCIAAITFSIYKIISKKLLI